MMNIRERRTREFSDIAFDKHQITERLRSGAFRSWRCQRQENWDYGFDITTIPGSLILTGDLGALVVSGASDMLAWCRNHINDIEHFANAVARETTTRELSEDILTAWLRCRIKNPELAPNLKAICKNFLDELPDKDPGWFYSELREMLDDSNPPDWLDWKPSFLWQRDAIRWFVTHNSEAQIVE